MCSTGVVALEVLVTVAMSERLVRAWRVGEAFERDGGRGDDLRGI